MQNQSILYVSMNLLFPENFTRHLLEYEFIAPLDHYVNQILIIDLMKYHSVRNDLFVYLCLQYEF